MEAEVACENLVPLPTRLSLEGIDADVACDNRGPLRLPPESMVRMDVLELVPHDIRPTSPLLLLPTFPSAFNNICMVVNLRRSSPLSVE